MSLIIVRRELRQEKALSFIKSFDIISWRGAGMG